jgi:AbiV family abortive infection protein
MNSLKLPELLKGLKLTEENACELWEDANLLFENKRYTRAYGLYQLAIEEAGKCIILFAAIVDSVNGKKISQKTLKTKGFTNHQLKSKESLKLEAMVLMMFKESVGDISVYTKALKQEHKIIEARNKAKNDSLYVSLNDNVFVRPSDIIGIEDAEQIKFRADIRVKAVENFSDTFTKDIGRLKLMAKEIKRLENDAEYRGGIEADIAELYS